MKVNPFFMQGYGSGILMAVCLLPLVQQYVIEFLAFGLLILLTGIAATYKSGRSK